MVRLLLNGLSLSREVGKLLRLTWSWLHLRHRLRSLRMTTHLGLSHLWMGWLGLASLGMASHLNRLTGLGMGRPHLHWLIGHLVGLDRLLPLCHLVSLLSHLMSLLRHLWVLSNHIAIGLLSNHIVLLSNHIGLLSYHLRMLACCLGVLA